MLARYNRGLAVAVCFLFSISVAAQTEFPAEFIAHVKLTSGAITRFNATPDRFAGTVQVVPQYTLKTQLLRGGAVAALAYADKKAVGLFGPTVSLKLKEFKAGYFGSLGNLHLNVDHLWSTKKRALAGGGINLDLLNKLLIGLTAHRDYKQGDWWFQTAVGFRISKVTSPKQTFPH